MCISQTNINVFSLELKTNQFYSTFKNHIQDMDMVPKTIYNFKKLKLITTDLMLLTVREKSSEFLPLSYFNVSC